MDLTKIGRVIRDKRIEHNELLYDMAKYLGIGSAHMSKLETGQEYFTKDIIYKLMEKYNFSNSDVFEMTKQFSGTSGEVMEILNKIKDDGGV